jgi:hypothetical protein
MRRRALIPFLERVEERIAATAGISAPLHGLHGSVGHFQSTAAPYWASISLRNDTQRPLMYRIVITTSEFAPFIWQETLTPGEKAPWRASFPPGGTFPNFSVSLLRVAGRPVRSGSKLLYPSVTTFEPSGQYITANSFTYSFQTNPNGAIGLYPTFIE